MAADQERNRKIAEALGYHVWINRPTERLFIITGRDEDMECDLTEMLDEIDFSLPDWQIKIQEKVEKLAAEQGFQIQYIKSCDPLSVPSLCLVPGDYRIYAPHFGNKQSSTRKAVYEDALLWLHERKVKND